MSNPSSIPAGLPVVGSGNSTAPSRTVTPVTPPGAQEAKPVQLFVNPSYRFDPTVGLVVIEFHNESGDLSNSIPSQRQLEAYRLHRDTLPGDAVQEASRPTETAIAKPGDAKTPAR
jgi:hypothetical protein